MRAESSLLAQLVIAYHEKFGRHVPESALRLLAAGDLAAILQGSLATNVPLAETGWDRTSPMGFSPRGCRIVGEEPKHPHRRRDRTMNGSNRGRQRGYGKPLTKTPTVCPERGHVYGAYRKHLNLVLAARQMTWIEAG